MAAPLAAEPAASRSFPSASLGENLRFNLLHVVPNLLQGLFLRRPAWVRRFTRLDTDGRAVRLCRHMVDKYGGAFYVRVIKDRSLLVADPEAIRHVLDRSPDVYGPPKVKVKGMSRFQPGAVTISEGERWRERRRFNEGVLDTGVDPHRLAAGFLELAREEVDRTRAAAGDRLAWPDLARLFERVTLGVVFGPAARAEGAIARDLATLMRSGNLPIGRGEPEVLARFQAVIRRHLEAPQAGSLLSLAAAAGGAEVPVEGQVPHWIFAMKDTLGTNAARALAVIGAHPRVEARVRAELAAADLASPMAIARLEYLKGVILEAMRLWPTTPLLSRRALADDRLDGRPVPAGTQVLILNLLNHRQVAAHPDDVHPERWAGGFDDVRFNHFSHGPQVCAGVDLALFVGRAVLAGLLARERWELAAPPLDPARPMPHMLDPFALAWSRRPLAARPR
jgi:cytochrome P450